jgi:hypothetical protein
MCILGERYVKFCLLFFFRRYVLPWIDVSVSYKEGQAANVQRGRHKCRGRNSTLPILGQQEKKTHANYSPSLHLSPRVSSALKRPAAFHSTTSDQTLWMAVDDDGVAPSKITSFRCLQRHQHTRATPVQKSRTSAALPRQDCNQSESEIPWEGIRSSLSHQRRQAAHTSLASTQPSKRWVMDSWVWSQKGNAKWHGSRRLSSMSTVQHLLRNSSQRKNRHLAGARDFQTCRAPAMATLPWNKPREQDFVE